MNAKLAASVAAVFASAAFANQSVPAVSGTRSPLHLAIADSPGERACVATIAAAWRDASDARFFATAPTARLDNHELAVGTLAPLISVRVADGNARLLVVGSPLGGGLHFTTSGWRPRWPFC